MAIEKSEIEKEINLGEIFLCFAKIGSVTFGGGLAMLPMIENAVVNNKKWLEEDDYTEMITITNSVPGAFALNAGIFIGYKLRGIKGGIAGGLGIIVPSFLIILIIATILTGIQDNIYVEKFFIALRPVVFALVLAVGIKMMRKTLKLPFDLLLFAMAVILMLFTSISPAIIIVLGGLLGMIERIIRVDKAKEDK